jgi:tetratricopeptide (TPR) repeat protein
LKAARAIARPFSLVETTMSAQGPQADALVQQSLDLLRQSLWLQAETVARQVLQIDPRHLQGLNALAFALHTQGRHGESESAYLAMTQVEPGEPMHWMNVGTARRCDNRIDEALYAFARAAAMGAASADFYYNVALAHIARDDYESARALLEKALALNPGDAEIRYRFAFCCYETLRTDQALAALEGWESIGPSTPEIAAGAGQLMMKLGDVERAEPTVRRAVAENTDDMQAKLTLVQVLERTNRIAEARELLDRLLGDANNGALRGDLGLMHAQLAQREGRNDIAAAGFQRAIDDCKELHNRHFQEFPLAKSLDALGRYEQAFAVLSDAHRSQLAHLKMTAPLAVLRGAPKLSIADHPCDPQDVARWDASHAPSVEASPIFIVAFPRSGTTLLELTLDAHPQLKSMDEQPFLQNALDDMQAEGVAYPHRLADLTTTQLERIRAAYWRRVASRVQLAPGQRLVDKNPLNILRLPVIKRLFPRAKVLLAIRHPCDVVLSCFMQHFRAPDFALLCTDIPTLCQAYRHAFDFWYSQQAVLQADVLELRYENFVADFEGDARRVFEFLGLQWNDASLRPGAHALQKRFISTPSYSQVVQPINSKSVDRWRNYAPHFAASLPLLQVLADRWNYAL